VYTKLSDKEPIRQGDIFRWLPKIELLLGNANLPYLVEPKTEGVKVIDWRNFAITGEKAQVISSVKAVIGIVISQDCDASRSPNIAFAEIRPLQEIPEFKKIKEPPTPSTVVSIVTDHTRKNQKWYFLSESIDLGFDRKMGVDFESIFEVNRIMLVNNLDLLRLGRLDDDVAWPHFRERIAEFFRRYPYNEWYPLNSEEAQYYEEDHKKKDPDYYLDPRYRWQNPS